MSPADHPIRQVLIEKSRELAPGLELTERSGESLQSLSSVSSATSATLTDSDSECATIHEDDKEIDGKSFNAFRINYLFVILSIMLADGLQGMSSNCSVEFLLI